MTSSARLASPWVFVVGAVLGGLTLCFFMLLAVLGILGMPLPCGQEYIVWLIAAFGAALAAAFLGGNAAARAAVPLGGPRATALAVSLGGGVAVLVAMLVLMSVLVPEKECPSRFAAYNIAARVPDPDLKVKTFLEVCGCKPEEGELEMVRHLNVPGEPDAQSIEVKSIVDSGDVSRLRATIAQAPSPQACGGDFSFRVDAEQLLACSNGDQIPYVSLGRTRKMAAIDAIVIHGSMGGTAQGVATYMRQQGTAATHLIVSPQGEVLQLVPFDVAAAHVGRSEWKGVPINSRSIGIELITQMQDGKALDYPQVQLDAAAAIVEAITAKYGEISVLRHSDLDKSNHIDPGPTFDYSTFCKRVHCAPETL